MVPQEGILTWVCGFTMHPNMVGDEQAAYDFMNAWISPEAGQFIISEYGYGHANSKSYELVEQATLDALGMSDPKALFDEAAVQVDAEEPYRSRYIELVDQVKAGL
jgi:spermidine/putrescine-binding protein